MPLTVVPNELPLQRKALGRLSGQLSVLSVSATSSDEDKILDILGDIELVLLGMRTKNEVTIGDDDESTQ